MTEKDISVLEKQVRRLWAALGLLFMMTVFLMIVLVFNYLLLYNRVMDSHFMIPFESTFNFMLLIFGILFTYAVIIVAVAKHD